MQAAWQVILMVRGWPFFRRQQFLHELLKEVSNGAGCPVTADELLWNMLPEHICRAALKAGRTVVMLPLLACLHCSGAYERETLSYQEPQT